MSIFKGSELIAFVKSVYKNSVFFLFGRYADVFYSGETFGGFFPGDKKERAN